MIFLSNRHKYTAKRFFSFSLSPIVFFLSYLFRKKDIAIFSSSLNNEFSDNSRALFEHLYNDVDNTTEIFFVMNDAVQRHSLNKVYPGRFITNYKPKDILTIIKAKYWFCSAMELPLQSFFERKKRTVIHMGHGMLYKKVGLMENGIKLYKKVYYCLVSSNFSFSIATSEFFVPYISRGFGIPISRVKILPQPKTSLVPNPVEVKNPILKDSSSLNILYAPTWRPYSDVNIFPFSDFDLEKLNDFLSTRNVHVWLRVHPRFEQDIVKDLLDLPNVHLFSSSQYGEINCYLDYFDVLISDYSSIFFDFITLERPVLFFDYDVCEYNSKVGLIEDYEKIKCNCTTTSLEFFFSQVDDFRLNDRSNSNVVKVNRICNHELKGKAALDFFVRSVFKG